MGTGSGTNGLNSRIYGNSYAYQSQRISYPIPLGDSFAGFSKPMYSYQTYYTLADCGPIADSRVGRYYRSLGLPSRRFIPPTHRWQM